MAEGRAAAGTIVCGAAHFVLYETNILKSPDCTYGRSKRSLVVFFQGTTKLETVIPL